MRNPALRSMHLLFCDNLLRYYDMETKNAIIESVKLTTEDLGCLSAWVYLDYGGSGQGFGGYSLYLPKSFAHSTNQKNYAGHFIYRVLEIAGVMNWENVKGKTIRVKSNDCGVEEIGHIVRNDWFNPKKEFEELNKAK